MRTEIPFVKMHGLGNDFIIMNKSDIPEKLDLTQLVISASERRLGIGCDQFIIYEDQDGVIDTTIYNQDGSVAMACGNATRCLSRLIYQQNNTRSIIVAAGGRKIACEYHDDDNISVNMGEVSFDEPWMPTQSKLWEAAQQYNIEPKEMMCVDVANPHVVIFTKLLAKDQAIIGGNFQNSELFPEGVNVSFAQINGQDIDLIVWERGAGFTHACGSGAVATFAAANKLCFVEGQAKVNFKYGSLRMQKEGDDVVMTGPVSHLFDGTLHYES